MRGVVVEDANDDASSPRRHAGQGCAFQFALIITRLHIFHFAGASGGNPFGKMLEVGHIDGWSDAGQIETRIGGGSRSDCLYVRD